MQVQSEQNFFELSENDLKDLLKFGVQRSFKKNDVLFREGDDPDSVWLVRSGRVNLTKASKEGAESMVAFYTAGQTFCVAATIIDDPYPCRAQAATDTEVVAIPSEHFQALFDRLPRFAKRLLVEMAPQFCSAHCDCALSMESVDKRLAHTLLRLDRQFKGGKIPFTRQEISQMVNTTVETCIRILSDWDKRGWISGTRGKLELLKRDQMEELLG